MKKILLILTISISTFVFANQEHNNYLLNSIDKEKTITNLTASPNPFTNKTKISFHTEKSQNVILKINNLLGKVVFTKEFRAVKGENNITFYKDNLDSGVYIYSIQSNSEIYSKRLIIK